jgi:hypothetical protein
MREIKTKGEYHNLAVKYSGVVAIVDSLSMSQIRLLVVLVLSSPRRPGFAPRSVHVEFVVNKVALQQVFLDVLRFFPINIIPLLLCIHSYIIWGMDKAS